MSFVIKKLRIPGPLIIQPKVFRDARGFFAEIYKYPDFKKIGIKKRWLQVNYSKSKKNVLRGLHYQKKPMAQAKLINVLSGKIFDVSVDIRKGSPFFGQWVAMELTSAN